ncbi:pre-mRNA cleavage complex II protein Clp1 [Ascosphaera apis ARSEF 7405]|uniref:Polynucleotide 5'-hydroxyl-kinase GRC3 n=1 Tax=Ascosphaera apis ARSEF 7405 TaxID=392613 RepID=A0A167X105_9EURO|nr:pre-mRNA cleavage complex II protein Clp1 [Ascosphaera apis ARSEF 7405]
MSALPGLGLAEPTIEAQKAAGSTTTLHIEPGCEWRFEVNFLATTRVQVEYVAEETPMMEYANVHFGLETMRERARQSGKEGPRVLILGSDDAGKTSLTKILTAYATKRGRQPIVVNLDPSEGMLSVPPGGLTATAFRSMIDIEEGWGNGALYKPLVTRLGVAVASRLAEDPDAKAAGVIIDTPGILGSGKEASNELIHHIISEFAITTILVLGSERLYSTMHRTYNMKPIAASRQGVSTEDKISVVKLTKSGGCVDRDENFMKPVREAQIRSYFFGRPIPSTAVNTGSAAGTTLTLSPHAQQVDFNNLAIYNITVNEDEDDYDPAAFGMTNDSFLPGGSNDNQDDSNGHANSTSGEGQSSTLDANVPLARLPRASADVPIPLALENTILAVVNADPDAHLSDIRDSSVLGFLYVADVDEKKGKVRVLSPVGGKIPQRAMIWGRRWPGETIGLLG